MDSILKLLDWLLKRYEELLRAYPRVTRAVGMVILCGIALAGLYSLFALYVLNSPKFVVHRYFSALNKADWDRASQQLAPKLKHMTPRWLEDHYVGFSAHEDFSTAIAPGQNAIDVFLNGRIRYHVTYEFHVTVAHQDVDRPDRLGDILRAQLFDADRFKEIRSNPQSTPIRLHTKQTNLCTLQHFDGKGWLIDDYWKRVTETLKFQ